MYDRGFYEGMSVAQIRQKVTEEGFDPLRIADRPGFEYPPHQHAETKLLAFLQGGMTVHVEGQVFHCRAGDRLLIPGDAIHSAVVDSDGCVYFWSEKLL